MGMIACGVYWNGAVQKPNSVAEFELRINGFSKLVLLCASSVFSVSCGYE